MNEVDAERLKVGDKVKWSNGTIEVVIARASHYLAIRFKHDDIHLNTNDAEQVEKVS